MEKNNTEYRKQVQRNVNQQTIVSNTEWCLIDAFIETVPDIESLTSCEMVEEAMRKYADGIDEWIDYSCNPYSKFVSRMLSGKTHDIEHSALIVWNAIVLSNDSLPFSDKIIYWLDIGENTHLRHHTNLPYEIACATAVLRGAEFASIKTAEEGGEYPPLSYLTRCVETALEDISATADETRHPFFINIAKGCKDSYTIKRKAVENLDYALRHVLKHTNKEKGQNND